VGNPNIVGDYELGKRRSFGCRAEKTEPPNNHHIARTDPGEGEGGERTRSTYSFNETDNRRGMSQPPAVAYGGCGTDAIVY